DRIRKMAHELHLFYGGGKHSCLLDSLSFGFKESTIKRHVREGMGAWVEALAKVAREAGVSPKKARQQAQDAISLLQGGLVMARVLNDTGPFERTLANLPHVILNN
ncbi:MAG: TetR/AcrR family transcriptional regulator, partial [Nitrospirota bacterium]|nr:TetR/AcrR family transcriptional regulator [Nitrospirota bacterium]